MKYERFEDLPVWRAAIELAARTFEWTKHELFRGKGDLANQLQRAALSISNNVAEGFERGSTKELIQFIYIARGSAGEVRSMLCVVEKMLEGPSSSEISNLKSQISNLKSQAESISRQLRGWANSLQNSDIEGQRHLDDRSRASYERKQRRGAVQAKLDAFQNELRNKLESRQQSSDENEPELNHSTSIR